MPVTVHFDATRPETHLIRVTQTFPATADDERTFRMAAWVPGSYKIRDFGRHVQDLEATVDGKKARATQTGKDAWTVSGTKGKAVELVFDSYCRELTVDTSHVTADHAHLFPATLVLYDGASRGEPHKVSVDAPKGWKLWSGLETKALAGTLETASDFDHLLDCPIELGPASDYVDLRFSVRRKKHRFVVWMPPVDMDKARIETDVKAIIEHAAKLFGGLPYEHYTFITHVAKDYGGGLEHRNSTVLGVDPLNLVADEQIQTKLLPLVAHEFFHTWNVKRILPERFQPYDLQTETYTDLLFMFEGFTTYYELPLLARAGVISKENWGKFASEMLKYYEMAIGRKRRSVAEASRLTWTLLYQPHEHNVNRNVSYYTKGMFVGLCLDHHLRTHGHADGLDTVMRHLWEKYGKTGTGVPEDGLANIVKDATGIDVRRILDRWVHGTSELPVDKAFKGLGWDVKRDWPDEKKHVGLGVTFKGKTARIERIPDDVPSFEILQPDDELIAVDGYQWTPDRLAELAAFRGESSKVRLHFFRDGRLRDAEVPLTTLPKSQVKVVPRKGDAAAARRRRAWLGDAWRD